MEPHPLGIQPLGNLLNNGGQNIRDTGLGELAPLNDEQILSIVQTFDAKTLINVSLVSKSLYYFCSGEDIWKQLVLEEFSGNFIWGGSWKETYRLTSRKNMGLSIEGTSASAVLSDSERDENTFQTNNKKRKNLDKVEKKKSKKKGKKHMETSCILGVKNVKVAVNGFYSDLLYQPWFCANVPISEDWISVENIDRRSNLSVTDFQRLYEEPNVPVILTDVVSDWPALKKWDFDFMRRLFKGQKVVISNYEMDLDNYLTYSSQQREEMPLYLFDRKFCERAPQLQKDFSVPPHFQDDLFALLGEGQRPDYRWLILGPERSGSSFHIDPNATCAWNAVVTGSKKWIMFPPNIIPPGVHPSSDGADVATPISIAEWFLNFYDSTKELKTRPLEAVVRPGEVIFVPRGWWHLVWNLEQGIAVTQNFVSPSGLPHTLKFLKSKRCDLVSGCEHDKRSSLYDLFYRTVKEKRPALIEAYEAVQLERRRLAEESQRLSALFGKGKSFLMNKPMDEASGRDMSDSEDFKTVELQDSHNVSKAEAKNRSRTKSSMSTFIKSDSKRESNDDVVIQTELEKSKTIPSVATMSSVGSFSFGFQI